MRYFSDIPSRNRYTTARASLRSRSSIGEGPVTTAAPKSRRLSSLLRNSRRRSQPSQAMTNLVLRDSEQPGRDPASAAKPREQTKTGQKHILHDILDVHPGPPSRAAQRATSASMQPINLRNGVGSGRRSHKGRCSGHGIILGFGGANLRAMRENHMLGFPPRLPAALGRKTERPPLTDAQLFEAAVSALYTRSRSEAELRRILTRKLDELAPAHRPSDRPSARADICRCASGRKFRRIQ